MNPHSYTLGSTPTPPPRLLQFTIATCCCSALQRAIAWHSLIKYRTRCFSRTSERGTGLTYSFSCVFITTFESLDIKVLFGVWIHLPKVQVNFISYIKVIRSRSRSRSRSTRAYQLRTCEYFAFDWKTILLLLRSTPVVRRKHMRCRPTVYTGLRFPVNSALRQT